MPKLGQEYLTSNKFSAFPFAENAARLAREVPAAHGAAATLPLDFLLDAVLCVPAGVTAVYLSAIVASGADRIFQFADQNGAALFDYTYIPTADRVIGVQDATNLSALRMLKGDSFDTYLAGTTGTDTYADGLPFESCVVDVRAPRVESFQIYQTPMIPCPTNPGLLEDHVRLIGGYNVNIRPMADATLDTTDIRIEAIPGAGAGKVPCTPAVTDPPAPMRLIPDNAGSVFLVGDACYSVNALNDATLQVSGDCFACCSCDNYVAAAMAVKALIARANFIKTQLFSQWLQHYSPSLLEYHTRHFPQVRKLYMHVKAIHGLTSRQGSAKRHGQIAVVITNVSDAAASGLVLTTTVTPAATVIDSGTWTTGNSQVGTVAFPAGMLPNLGMGDGIVVIYRVKTANPSTPPATVSVQLAYTLHGQARTVAVAQAFE